MENTNMQELADFGQSLWLDNISRSLIQGGKLRALIDKGLRGLTSNPTIFEYAINSGTDYDQQIVKLVSHGRTTFEIYDELTINDIQKAADIFHPINKLTNGVDGYVSLEINPQLARKTEETIEEGRRLHNQVDRENLMLKVPATKEGFPAITQLVSEGKSVNITLIFSLEQYILAAEAYIKGLERYLEREDDARQIHSVASVFVSRIETAVDNLLREKKIGPEGDALKGKAAVANSKIIYERYQHIFSGERFKALQIRGANVQRVLWASTGTKNDDYSDIKYIEELIGKGSVNTAPEKTIEAFLDHGKVVEGISNDVENARKVISNLKALGIDINDVCRDLQNKGVDSFQRSFESFLETIKKKKELLCQET